MTENPKKYYSEIGTVLSPVKDNIYIDKHSNVEYIINNDKPIPLIDPITGSSLKYDSDGKLHSKGTDGTFTFDKTKDAFIPQYVPDRTSEKAHIEGDYLVGNETGREFPIDEYGTVIVPNNYRKLEEQQKTDDNGYQLPFELREKILREKEYNETQQYIDETIADDKLFNQEKLEKILAQNEKENQIKREKYNKIIDKIEEKGNQQIAKMDQDAKEYKRKSLGVTEAEEKYYENLQKRVDLGNYTIYDYKQFLDVINKSLFNNANSNMTSKQQENNSNDELLQMFNNDENIKLTTTIKK